MIEQFYLTLSTVPDQSRLESNGNERVLYTHRITGTGASPSNEVQCHTPLQRCRRIIPPHPIRLGIRFEDFTVVYEGSPHGVMANVLGHDIVVSEFELQSCYYVKFRSYTLGKDMNHLIPQLWIK